MVLLAAIAAVTSPPVQARASVRIARAAPVNRESWERSARRGEILVREGGRAVTIRLIEFE